MRRLSHVLPWLVAFCLALLPIASAGAAGSGLLPLAVFVTTVSIDGPFEVAVGSSFTVDVAVDYVEDFNSASFDVVYDQTIITVTNVTGGDIDGDPVEVGLGDWTFIPPGPDDTGRIRVLALVPGMVPVGVTGGGYIARVHFDVLGADGDSSDIGLEGLAMYDVMAQRIDTTTVDGAVEVVAPLVITACGAVPSPTKVGYPTDFSVTVSGGVSPYAYAWTFGDGGTSAAPSPTYTYGTAGTYMVSVTVTDDEGDMDDCSFQLVVNPPLSVSDCQAHPNPTKVEYATDFSVTVSGGVEPYTYAWDFGDGVGASDQAVPTYTYGVPGTYDVTVTVTDSLDNVDDCTFKITVNPPLSVSDCEADPNPTKVGYETSFSVTASGGVGEYTYEWSFGDGNTSAEAAPTHAYDEGDDGTQTVSVTVTDSLGDVQTCTFDLVVNPPLSVSDCEANPNPTKVGYETSFSVTASGGVGEYTYEWSFGDGNTSAEAAPTHTYDEGDDGTQTVSVTVTDSLGDVQTCTFDLVVNPPLSVSDCGANPDPTKVSHATDFSVTVSGGVGPYTYAWDFGDGNGSTEAAPTHTYAVGDDGARNVSVTVTDSLGNVQSCSFELVVNPPLEIITVGLPDGEVGEEYSVALEATGGVEPYAWEATGLPAGLTCSADGVISGTPIGEVGEFTVTVSVTCDLLNTDSKILTLTVWCKPGDANLDGFVDSGDITKVKRIYFGLDSTTPCADVNGDGFVDAGDITAIRTIMFGDM